MSGVRPEVLRARAVGRFELRRELGRGAQASVWLADDPRLQRQVALKCLDPAAGDVRLHQWLREARAVSRLSHPHIVPLFEADTHDGAAYLVFEYVDGPTLAEARHRRGPMPAREAVGLLLGVLQGLALAHRHGIVHRDLKPSNILIDGDGRPRVMDFGIAASVGHGGDGLIAGTAGYMSPEAARGEAPCPAMDVFAAGAVLAELLSGQRLHDGGDARNWLDRVQHETLQLPEDLAVDDALRAIVHRALARDPVRRFDSAQALHDALQAWLQPAAAADPAVGVAGHGTLDFLLRRMRHRSDFPALSDAVQRIHRVASSESESLARLCDEVLKDVALTNKLLRLVNTAHYAAAGSIGTISRAVQVVGFAGIRNMALSLVLLEHMSNRAQAALLQQEFLRAVMAGTLAGELAGSAGEREQAFLGAMFQGLGRLLTEYYLPEEGQQIRQRLPSAGQADAMQLAHRRQTASAEVLGIAFEDLGIGVARAWGLPEALQRCMRAADGRTPTRAVEGESRLRWLASAANAMTDALLDAGADQADDWLRRAALRHAPAVGLASPGMLQAVERARERMRETVQALALQAEPDAPVQRLIAREPTLPVDAGLQLAPTIDLGTAPTHIETLGIGGSLPDAADQLAAGLQDITQALVASDFSLPQVLRMVLETIYRALGAQRVLFCLRDPRAPTLVGRFGLGADVEALCPVFRIPLQGPALRADLFAAACSQGADALISDSTAPAIAPRLPSWYRERVAAPSFLLLPLRLKDAPIALIYADKARAGAFELDGRALSLLRTLRNQAVMAFRQAGGG